MTIVADIRTCTIPPFKLRESLCGRSASWLMPRRPKRLVPAHVDYVHVLQSLMLPLILCNCGLLLKQIPEWMLHDKALVLHACQAAKTGATTATGEATPTRFCGHLPAVCWVYALVQKPSES